MFSVCCLCIVYVYKPRSFQKYYSLFPWVGFCVTVPKSLVRPSTCLPRLSSFIALAVPLALCTISVTGPNEQTKTVDTVLGRDAALGRIKTTAQMRVKLAAWSNTWPGPRVVSSSCQRGTGHVPGQRGQPHQRHQTELVP